MSTIRIITVEALIVAGAMTLHAVQAQQTGATRTELQRHDLSAVGREVIQVRVDLEPGRAFPGHTHPGEEIIYVLEGTWEYVIGGKPVTARAGGRPVHPCPNDPFGEERRHRQRGGARDLCCRERKATPHAG